MIKVSITADSWNVGAAGLITMLVFTADRDGVQKQEDQKAHRKGKSATAALNSKLQ